MFEAFFIHVNSSENSYSLIQKQWSETKLQNDVNIFLMGKQGIKLKLYKFMQMFVK